jgi:hypothetical protein
MTQIDNPEKRIELRKWVWLMLMRSRARIEIIDTSSDEEIKTTDSNSSGEKGRDIQLTRGNLAKIVVDYAVNLL